MWGHNTCRCEAQSKALAILSVSGPRVSQPQAWPGRFCRGVPYPELPKVLDEGIYALNYIGSLILVEGIFFNEGLLEALGRWGPLQQKELRLEPAAMLAAIEKRTYLLLLMM